MKPIQLVILKSKIVRKPYSGEVVGVRIQAAYPNNDRTIVDSELRTTSFSKKYIITQSSDCSETDIKEVFKKFVRTLKEYYGFTHYRCPVSKDNPEPEIIKL